MSQGALAELLCGRISPEAAAWLRAGLAEVAGQGKERFGARWSGAGRRLGKAALALTVAEEGALQAAGAPFVPRGWGADECGRALLLLALVGPSATAEHAALV